MATFKKNTAPMSPGIRSDSKSSADLQIIRETKLPLSRLTAIPMMSNKSAMPTGKSVFRNGVGFPSKTPKNGFFNDFINSNKDLSLYYVESTTGKPVKHKMDFNTPRTKEAAARAGITFEDCVQK